MNRVKEKANRILCEHTKAVALGIAVAMGIIALTLTSYRTHLVTEAKVQKKISEEVLRFHVLANSDREEDQKLKLKVRDEILSYLQENLPEEYNLKQTEFWVKNHLEDLENIGRQTVIDEGYEYGVDARLENSYFPERTYGDVTFPAGKYRALRICIGQAQGHNWWCVLYPNLCFTDAVHAVVPEDGKDKIKSVLSEEEYRALTATSDFKIRWFFL